MPRIRTIKPTFWDSEKLGQCTILARLTFVGLISYADDAGRGRGEVRFLIGHLHPYAKDVTEEGLHQALLELVSRNLVTLYDVDGFRYYSLPGFTKHQYIDRPRTSEIPKFGDGSANVRRKEGESFGDGSAEDKEKDKEKDKDITTAKAVDSRLDPGTKEVLEQRMPFGQYKSVYIINVPAEYCKWMLQEYAGTDRLSKNIRAGLKARLELKEGAAAGMSKTPRISTAKEAIH